MQILHQRNLQLLKNNETVHARIDHLEQSIIHAAKIQTAIFPDEKRLQEVFPASFILNLPKDVVSGDFCWIKSLHGKRIIAVGDCTGHGVPGAYVSALVYQCLEKVFTDFGMVQVDLVMEELNYFFLETFKYNKRSIIDEGVDVALLAFDETENYLEFCGARNGFLLARGDEIIHIQPSSRDISTRYEQKESFYSSKHQLIKGDSIYLFSDGFKDQFGGSKGKKYMIKRLRKFLLKISSEGNMAAQRKLLYEEFLQWKGEETQVDDVMVVGIRYE